MTLLEKLSGLIHQFAKFGAIGLLSTGIYYVLFLSLLTIAGATLSYAIAYIVSMAFGVLMNLRFTFATTPSGRKIGLFVLVYLVSMVIGGVFLDYLIGLSIAPQFAGLLTIVVTVLTNFFGLKVVAKRG